MTWAQFFMNPAVVWVLIPVTAIVVSGVRSLARMYFRHQERMAMIQQGLLPDADAYDPVHGPESDFGAAAAWRDPPEKAKSCPGGGC